MKPTYYPELGVFRVNNINNPTSFIFNPRLLDVDDTSLEEACKVIKILIKKSDAIYKNVRPRKDVAKEKRKHLSIEQIMESCNFYQIKIKDLINE